MKRALLPLILVISQYYVQAQTLQSVTNTGAETSTTIGAAGFYPIGLGYNKPAAYLISAGDTNWSYGATSDNMWTYRMQVSFYGANQNTRGFRLLHKTNNTFPFLVDGNGNVGIGDPNPLERLSVNGKIRAKEIKVEADPWPDYVFDVSYKLPDLNVTEQFIKENKHLPEIPSAAEIAKKGVNLGEMNALLLKKIEELTLYVIDLKKEVEILKSNK